jgi:hypothetical protein
MVSRATLFIVVALGMKDQEDQPIEACQMFMNMPYSPVEGRLLAGGLSMRRMPLREAPLAS